MSDAPRPTLANKEAIIIECIKLGMGHRPACRAAGCSYTSFKRWRQASGPFRAQIKAAEAEYERTALQSIHDAAKPTMGERTQWQAAAWLLERRHPERWGKRETRDVNMKVGPSDWSKMTTEERQRAVAEAELQLAAAKADLERGK